MMWRKPAPAAPPPAHRYTMAGREMAPVLAFDDVVMQHMRGRENPGVLWPDFDLQYGARHLRMCRPCCTKPVISAPVNDTINDEAVFLSALDGHFGHVVAEAAPRLLQVLQEHGHRPILVTGGKGQPANAPVPPVFLKVMEWLDLPARQLRIVNTPTRVRRLYVAPQAEHVDGNPPAEAYLDLLDRLMIRRGIKARPEGIVYVARTRLDPKLGGHAGEAYLVEVLRELGVSILYPEQESLHRQMACYAGARRLIFAEGSAIHGRQLIGRVGQGIDVLVRRRGYRMAWASMQPRCDNLGYVPATLHEMQFLTEAGKPWPHSTVAIYRLPTLLDYFEAIGLPIRSVWDQAAYERARDDFALAWLRALHSPNIDPWLKPHGTPDHLLNQMQQYGLEHLIPTAREMMVGRYPAAGSPA